MSKPTPPPRRTTQSANAERQAAYRARHLHSPETVDAERLNTVVSISAKQALVRLARHYGVTQRAMLERLLADAENAVVDRLKGKAQSAYYDGPSVEDQSEPAVEPQPAVLPEMRADFRSLAAAASERHAVMLERLGRRDRKRQGPP